MKKGLFFEAFPKNVVFARLANIISAVFLLSRAAGLTCQHNLQGRGSLTLEGSRRTQTTVAGRNTDHAHRLQSRWNKITPIKVF